MVVDRWAMLRNCATKRGGGYMHGLLAFPSPLFNVGTMPDWLCLPAVIMRCLRHACMSASTCDACTVISSILTPSQAVCRPRACCGLALPCAVFPPTPASRLSRGGPSLGAHRCDFLSASQLGCASTNCSLIWQPTLCTKHMPGGLCALDVDDTLTPASALGSACVGSVHWRML